MKLILRSEILKDHDYVSFSGLLLEKIPRGSTILMKGDVGAGKTTFISTVCHRLGLGFTQSPTYAIHNHYENLNASVDHFDLYRLESEDEIQASGFYDLMAEPADYKFIEWSEKIKAADLDLARPLFQLVLTVNADLSRTCELYSLGS